MIAIQDKIIITALSIFLLITIFYLIRFIYWRNIKFDRIVENETSISLLDKKTMQRFIGVPGVWAQYVGKECWNVCKTQDIGSEMLLDVRRAQTGLNNVVHNDKRLRERYTYQGSVAIKYRDLVRYAVKKRKKIKFVIVITDVKNDNELEFEEMKYALKHKAIAWKPAPGKQTKVYWAWKNGGGNINKYKKMMLN